MREELNFDKSSFDPETLEYIGYTDETGTKHIVATDKNQFPKHFTEVNGEYIEDKEWGEKLTKVASIKLDPKYLKIGGQ